MRKTITSFMTLLVALVLALPASAQVFFEKVGEPVPEIELGVDYILANPWGSDLYLGPTGGTNRTLSNTLWQFEDSGKKDADGYTLYRLKNTESGEYLMDPDKAGGAVKTNASIGNAFHFTGLPGVGYAQFEIGEGDNKQPDPEWEAGDDRTKYWNNGVTFENVFVFYNANTKSGYHYLETHQNIGVQWKNYVEARIWHLYKCQKMDYYNNFCESVNMLFPNPEAVPNLFEAGTAPGQVDGKLIEELLAAFQAAQDLVLDQSQPEATYTEALARLLAAKKACEDNVVPVTPGFYVIDNNPAAGRPSYAHTNNACLTERNGELHWAGFDKPEVMTVDGAAFIWELTRAEGTEDGWYLRNYGTNRYAGGLNQNYQCVPSTETAQQVFKIVKRSGKYFSLDMVGQHKTYPSYHADQNDGLRIVIWEPGAAASQWAFLPVNAAELEGIESELAQNRINKAAKALFNLAQANYNKGFAYTAEGCSRDSVFNTGDGLITTEDQMISNAPEDPANEPGNCYNNLIDGNFETYFHTVWSSAAYASSFHYLDVRLNEAIDCFNIKYAKRHNGGGQGSPVKVHVFASNDTVGGNWTDQGIMTCTYPYATTYTNGEGNPVKKNEYIGVASHKLDGKYAYIRLQVEGTKENSKTNGNLYWYWSELRMYASAYDPSISLIEAVPADVKKALEDAMAVVKEELAAEKVQQTSLDALQKAYDNFMANYPDPQIVKNLIRDARAKAAAAAQSEGDAIGFFKPGAAANLTAVIDAVEAKVKPIMTVAEVDACKAELEKALEAFNAMLIVPETDQFIYIKCATQSEAEGSAKDKYLYAQNNDESQIKYGLFDRMEMRPEFVWKTVKNEDGSYHFMNVATGTYLGNPKAHNARVNMSWEADTVKLGGTNVGGVFNVLVTDKVYFNAQPGTGNLVTWNTASGTDNSAFIFEPVDAVVEPWDGNSVRYNFASQNAEVISKPYDLCGLVEGADLYKVLGMKDGALQLAAYGADELIPAGTPFIAIPNGEPNADGVYEATFYMPLGADYTQMQYVFEGQKQNGLLATIQTKENIAGGGVLFENNVISAVEGDKSRCNSGYFAEMPAATTETGAYTMTFPENITGIVDVIVNSAAKGGVYSLTGVKVRNNASTKGLPKGLYIVGGQKVLVK